LAEARARRGDAEWARTVLRQLATGLRVLHEHDVVHRDLKPSNVLLARDESGEIVVKIADFGIARFAARSDAARQETVSPTAVTATNAALTRAGVLLGTPAYMAPELATGASDALPSADVFAFGVIAYELLTDRYPFAQPPIHTPGVAHLARAPLATSLPAWCASVVDGCLSMDPAQRPTAIELEALLDDRSSRAAVASSPPVRARP
ncbi:MAG: protein kinase, partial [Polyangiales bacterium]